METLIQDCQFVSNVTILCQDGLVNTHKIILAGISDFIKSIIEEIPVGDQVTLFMPDFTSGDIDKFLLVSMKGINTGQSLDLEKAFGVKAQKQDGNVKIKIIAENVKPELDEIDFKDEFEMYYHSDGEEDIEDEDKTSVIEFPEEKNAENGENSVKKYKQISGGERSNAKAASMMSVEDFQEKIRRLEEKIIASPTTKKELIKNKKTKININFQKAFSDIIHKGFTAMDASIKYNIPRSTLSSLIRSGKFEWRGRGKRSSNYFTEEEEEKICRVAKDRTDGGLYLNKNILRQVITEEIAIIQSLEPERKFREINSNFVLKFGNRHDLLR